MVKRLGPLSEAVRDRLREASTADLERWSEGIFVAASAEDLLRS